MRVYIMPTELSLIVESYDGLLNGIRNGKVDAETMNGLRSILKRLKKLRDSSNKRFVVSSSFDGY